MHKSHRQNSDLSFSIIRRISRTPRGWGRQLWLRAGAHTPAHGLWRGKFGVKLHTMRTAPKPPAANRFSRSAARGGIWEQRRAPRPAAPIAGVWKPSLLRPRRRSWRAPLVSRLLCRSCLHFCPCSHFPVTHQWKPRCPASPVPPTAFPKLPFCLLISSKSSDSQHSSATA